MSDDTKRRDKPLHLGNRTRKLLDGFAKDYGRLDWRIQRRCGKYTDARLAEAIAACGQLSDINCWYATYQVAPMVLAAVKHEQAVRAASARAKAAENVGAAPSRDAGGSEGQHQ